MKKGEATTTGGFWLRSGDPTRNARRARLKLPWIGLLAVCLVLPIEAWPPLLLFGLFLSLAYLDERES